QLWRYASIVHQQIEPAKTFPTEIHQRSAIRTFRDISAKDLGSNRFGSAFQALLRGFKRGCFVLGEIDDEIVADPGQFQRDATADTARAACNERHWIHGSEG